MKDLGRWKSGSSCWIYKLFKPNKYGYWWSYQLVYEHETKPFIVLGVGDLGPPPKVYLDWFEDFPNISEDELTLFELEFGIDGSPLKELKHLMQHV